MKIAIQRWINVCHPLCHSTTPLTTYSSSSRNEKKKYTQDVDLWQLDLIFSARPNVSACIVGGISAKPFFLFFPRKFHRNHLYRRENGVNMHAISDNVLISFAHSSQIEQCVLRRSRSLQLMLHVALFWYSAWPEGKIKNNIKKMKRNCIYIH